MRMYVDRADEDFESADAQRAQPKRTGTTLQHAGAHNHVVTGERNKGNERVNQYQYSSANTSKRML